MYLSFCPGQGHWHAALLEPLLLSLLQGVIAWWRCRAVKQALRPGATKLLMLESPTNPRMQVCDLRALAEAAHEAGALVCVDNSIMAFLYQRPLDLGADISMTSATKFVSGHSDVTAGLLSVRDERLGQRIYFHQVKCGHTDLHMHRC